MVHRSPAKKTPNNRPKKKTKKKSLSLRDHLSAFRNDAQDDIVSVHSLADLDCVAHVRKWVSTGCLELDRVLTPPALMESEQIGGIPCGRVSEIYGPAHIGKSTLLDHIFVSVQRAGGAAILLETDAGRDAHYSGRIGVDTKTLQYFQFEEDEASIENVVDEAIKSIRWWKHNAPDIPVVVGFDALGVTPTQEEIKKTIREGTTASAAKVLRKACRKISAQIAGTNVAFVILNHEYQVISFMGGGVQKARTYGGDALPLLSAVRIKLHPVKDWFIKQDGIILGHKVGYEVMKFKLGGAYRKGEFAIISGYGIDNTWTLWDTLGKAGIIAISGSWGAININGDTEKFQGWNALRKKCSEDGEFFGKIVDVYHQYIRKNP